MDQFKRKKSVLELKAQELEKRKRDHYREIGEKLYGLPPAEDEPPPCAALRESILAGEEAVRKNGELRRELELLVGEAEEVEQLQKGRRQDLRDITKDNLGLYEKIGRAGFQAYREGTLQGEELDALFAPLLEQKERINTYEVELKGENGSGDSLFRRVVRRGRKVLLKGNQSLELRNMTKVYQKAGENLALIENLSYQGIEPLEQAFVTLLQNRASLKSLEEKLAEGEARTDEIAETLKNRDALRLPRRRIAGLEREEQGLKEARGELLADFGGACEPLAQAEGTLSEQLIARGEALAKENLEIRGERARLERDRRLNELGVNLKKRQQEREGMEKAMERQRRALESLDEEIRRITEEREALKKEDKP